jgi:hypothetical protein
VLFAELAGRHVQRSVAEVHVGQDDSESLMRIGLHFGDGNLLTLACSPDGQSLQAELGDFKDYDMREYGHVEVRELKALHGSTIDAAIPLVDEDHLTFGVLLRVHDRDLFVFNWGDDLYVEKALPEHVRKACISALPV